MNILENSRAQCALPPPPRDCSGCWQLASGCPLSRPARTYGSQLVLRSNDLGVPANGGFSANYGRLSLSTTRLQRRPKHHASSECSITDFMLTVNNI